MIITMGVLNMATATLFPQDVWGTPATFAGQMHILLVSIMALLSMLATLLLGLWLQKTDIFPGYGVYSFITVGVMVLAGGFAVATLDSSIMGLTEKGRHFRRFAVDLRNRLEDVHGP